MLPLLEHILNCGAGAEGRKWKRTSKISTTCTANSAHGSAASATRLTPLQKVPLLIKISTITKLDQMWPHWSLQRKRAGSGSKGPPWRSLEVAVPHLSKWSRAAGRGSTALVPCLSSNCCQADFSAAGTNYFPGMNPLGKLFTPVQLRATSDLPQTAGLLPPRLAKGTITQGIRPYFPCASWNLARSVARSHTWAVCCRASSFGSHNL